MPLTSNSVTGSIEQCVDEIGELTAALAHHSSATLACALRIHLAALLHVMLERGECNAQEVAEFVRELGEEFAAPERAPS